MIRNSYMPMTLSAGNYISKENSIIVHGST